MGAAQRTPELRETLEETAIREVTEETGLKVSLEAPIDFIRYWFVRPDDGVRCHKTVHFYLMSAVGGSLDDHDHEFDEVRWSSGEEVPPRPDLRERDQDTGKSHCNGFVDGKESRNL